jgi:pyruvate dehydrogenase E2 component (dihydrolipoamide acetyltransferase)
MSQIIEVQVPDIGDFKEVEIIELLVKTGDTVAVEQSLITVESDKASMEIPSSAAGVVQSIVVKLGDKVKKGSVVLTLLAQVNSAASAAAASKPAENAVAPAVTNAPAAVAASISSAVASSAVTSLPAISPASVTPAAAATVSVVATGSQVSTSVPSLATVASENGASSLPHASPSVRKFARELGVQLQLIQGSGPKGRVTPDDVRNFVKQALETPVAAQTSAGTGSMSNLGIAAWPVVDFAKYGPITSQAMSRIKRISGPVLHRNWVMIPHVTNNEDADITELEAFRVKLNQENEKSGNKLTMLAFLIKASVSALKKFPEFNSSLDGDNLVLKQYYHIGFAADTPNGLVVPVIKDADKKGLFEIAAEMGELAKKARDGKLGPADMQGGTFSISSLGGIGGTSFTPIINAPEVAILGVSKSAMKPVWDGAAFVPRLILPLSLSWDHRVVDGASAARFNAYLSAILADFRRVLL